MVIETILAVFAILILRFIGWIAAMKRPLLTTTLAFCAVQLFCMYIFVLTYPGKILSLGGFVAYFLSSMVFWAFLISVTEYVLAISEKVLLFYMRFKRRNRAQTTQSTEELMQQFYDSREKHYDHESDQANQRYLADLVKALIRLHKLQKFGAHSVNIKSLPYMNQSHGQLTTITQAIRSTEAEIARVRQLVMRRNTHST